METKPFSAILAHALESSAARHGQAYPRGGALAWGLTGASYLAFALCGLPSSRLRDIQYRTRNEFGPVILDCKWYDYLKQECLEGKESADILIPGPDDNLCPCTVTGQLFLEMLDFCREG